MGKKLTASEMDGVVYRRAKTWRIALAQLNGGVGMCFYILMGYASYLANAGYGVATAIAGLIITGTRIFDGITDPLIALIIDKTNTKHGKIRILMSIGWLIESLAVLMLFSWASGKGHGVVFFVLTYMLYVIGYTLTNVTAQIINPVMVNDPKQRPVLQVWSTVYNYLCPLILSTVINVVILPKHGNEFSVSMLAEICMICVCASFVLLMLSFIGISHIDKPENFNGINAGSEQNKVGLRDMWQLLKSSRVLQTYIVSAASDKLANQTSSQAIVTTMLYGILIGNMGLGTILSMAAMLPSIAFVIIGAKYAGKHGNKEGITTWTKVCVVIAVLAIIFCTVVDLRQVTVAIVPTAMFFILTLLLNGAKMCVTASTGAMNADIIDFELERTGKFLPATIAATYSFMDKLISSLGATIAAGCVALIGYKSVMPQPTDAPTQSILIMTMFLYYGMPILGWICTLIAMRFSPLSKEKMIDVQKSIQAKKQEIAKTEPEGVN